MKVSQFKTASKKRQIKKNKFQKHKQKIKQKKVLHICLKSENKELRHELVENLENLKEQATRLQKCIAENGTLKKLCYYKAKTRRVEADKAKKMNMILHSY